PVGEAIDPPSAPDVWYRVVTPGYLLLMRMRLVAGRYFAAADRAGGAPVMIVNEQAARLLWPRRSAIGGIVATGADSGAERFTVVGVVASSRQDGPSQPVKAEAF